MRLVDGSTSQNLNIFSGVLFIFCLVLLLQKDLKDSEIVVQCRSKVVSSTCLFSSNTSPKAKDLKEEKVSSAQKFKLIVIRALFGREHRSKKKDPRCSGKKLKKPLFIWIFHPEILKNIDNAC